MTFLLALFSIGACHGGPVVDLSTKPVEADGTISGTVRGPEGTSAVEGRSVEVINVETGERQRAATNNAGGFTFKVKPGNYRVEVRYSNGVKRTKEITVAQTPMRAVIDEKE